jgi:hypothetical protein
MLEDKRQKESILILEYQNDLATLLLDHESKSSNTRNT